MLSSQIQNITNNEIITLIAYTFSSKIQYFIQKPKLRVSFLTQKETAKLLFISLVTLIKWSLECATQSFVISTLIKYNREEVINAFREVKSLKVKTQQQHFNPNYQ